MYDIIVALADSTENGAVIFAKNSDREANEAHHIEFVKAKNHPLGEMLQYKISWRSYNKKVKMPEIS